jgi:hypothetical protein
MNAMAGKQSLGQRSWVRAVEDASLERSHPNIKDAATRFDALGSPSKQMALVREVVEVRARELTLAYRNVVMVAAGYKSRTSAKGLDEVRPEPCVIFIVKRKWANRSATAETAQTLPQRLLTFGGNDDERMLYAVPTDVQEAQRYFGGVARSGNCVRVNDANPNFNLPGTLTCGVKVRGAPVGDSFALSAMHVLSPIPAQAAPVAGASFSAIGAGPSSRGSSAAWGGHIDVKAQNVFDVQLAEITDRSWFSTAFGGLALSKQRPYVVAPAAFDELSATMRFQILVADNHPNHGVARPPILAQFLMFNRGEMPLGYQVRFNGVLQTVPLRHNELLILKVLEDCLPPESGDSGSAVISWWPDGTLVLVGMFIGSGSTPGRERLIHVHPAWQLFNPSNWKSLPPGATEIEPTFTLL